VRVKNRKEIESFPYASLRRGASIFHIGFTAVRECSGNSPCLPLSLGGQTELRRSGGLAVRENQQEEKERKAVSFRLLPLVSTHSNNAR
jgi:hypothetical protein